MYSKFCVERATQGDNIQDLTKQACFKPYKNNWPINSQETVSTEVRSACTVDVTQYFWFAEMDTVCCSAGELTEFGLHLIWSSLWGSKRHCILWCKCTHTLKFAVNLTQFFRFNYGPCKLWCRCTYVVQDVLTVRSAGDVTQFVGGHRTDTVYPRCHRIYV